MERVSLLECKSYEFADTVMGPALSEYRALFPQGARILVKPNLLSAHVSQEAVTTHPQVVHAVLSFLLAQGCRPFLSDSPITQSVEEVTRVCGIGAVCKELGVPIQPFTRGALRKGWKFSGIRLAQEVFEVDGVVNIAKLKTHSQTVLTMAVKNTYGCMVGKEKQLWHVRAGSIGRFADLLIDIHGLVHPTLNIVDGVVGMEGNGPANGTPKPFGVIGIAQNGYCLDHALADRLQVREETVPVLVQSRKRGLIPNYEIRGEWHDTIMLPATALVFQASTWLGNRLPSPERWPMINPERCKLCRLCESHCPAKAIEIDQYAVDKKKCIRCYVCHECCPYDAIQLIL